MDDSVLTAMGPGSEEFHGFMESVEVFRVMVNALGLWAQDGLPAAVSGTLEVGSKTDANVGFVSLVRIVDAEVRTLR